MKVEDVRHTIEATLGNLTPKRAQELAKDFLEPGAAKDQVSKTANELLKWSQRNRERLREFVDHEVDRQMTAVGVARKKDVDALRKRIRDLERAAGIGPPARKTTTRKTTRKPAAKKPTTTSEAG
jgi:polyhydroxyalkanoate synthesis regulator phasin